MSKETGIIKEYPLNEFGLEMLKSDIKANPDAFYLESCAEILSKINAQIDFDDSDYIEKYRDIYRAFVDTLAATYPEDPSLYE